MKKPSSLQVAASSATPTLRASTKSRRSNSGPCCRRWSDPPDDCSLALCTDRAFVDELIRQGVKDVCFAPGSRSTPLVLLFAEHPKARLHRHIDERSAGFYALGIAKASRRPVALVCTSGTAAANFLPSIIEAFYGQVPLIVLTADRPPEARGVGSPQTIDQTKLYGDHVKWFAEMPLPGDGLVDHAHALAKRAYAAATEGPPGPVHLNFPFREPLLPDEQPFEKLPEPDAPAFPDQGAPVLFAEVKPARESFRPLARALAGAQRGLIICGPQENPALGRAVARLAARLQYPVLADPLSQVRCGFHSKELIIDAYDAFLRDEAFIETNAPELVLRFGRRPPPNHWRNFSIAMPSATSVASCSSTRITGVIRRTRLGRS